MVGRLEDWPRRLAAHIEGARNRPFSFGTQDCVLFAADAVLAITGLDPAPMLRGAYQDERSAMRILRTYGDLHALACVLFGECVNARMAQRGDICMVRLHGRDSLTVCEGALLWGPGETRLEAVPITEARCAWRIGN